MQTFEYSIEGGDFHTRICLKSGEKGFEAVNVD